MKRPIVHVKRESFDARIDRGSAFGNPFKVDKPDPGDISRGRAIHAYCRYLLAGGISDESLLGLAGKRLGCWCDPRPCHGESILARLGVLGVPGGHFLERNVLDQACGVIVHQVNCRKVMGSGLALAVRKKWPSVFSDYAAADMRPGDVLFTDVSGGEERLFVCCLAGQDGYGRIGVHTDYDAVAAGFSGLFRFASARGLPVYMPHGMGCGLGGGDWDRYFRLAEAGCPGVLVCVGKPKPEHPQASLIPS